MHASNWKWDGAADIEYAQLSKDLCKTAHRAMQSCALRNSCAQPGTVFAGQQMGSVTSSSFACGMWRRGKWRRLRLACLLVLLCAGLA